MSETNEQETPQTPLDKITEFIAGFPQYSRLARFHVDFTDKVPFNAGAFPDGLVEISRTRDIVGNVTCVNQLNFAIYAVFPKPVADDTTGAENADWVADFQAWVQEQSARGLAPTFGDVARAESIRAQNGMLYSADEEETALYMVQLSVTYTKKYRR